MDFSRWIPDYFDVVSARSQSGQDLTFLRQEETILKPWLCEAATLLDVGCATGYAYYNFRHHGINYYGIDSVADYIEEGRRSLSTHGLPPEHLQVADLYSFASDEAPYDVVMCNTVLQHLDDIRGAIEALARLTKTVLLIRTLTAEQDILRKTRTHEETRLPWHESRRSKSGVSFNVYSRDGLAKVLGHHFPSIETIADTYTTAQPVELFGDEHYSYSIFKCVR